MNYKSNLLRRGLLQRLFAAILVVCMVAADYSGRGKL